MFEILAGSTKDRIKVLIEIFTKAVLHSLNQGFNKVEQGILETIINRHRRRSVALEARRSSDRTNVTS